jgi:signal transduction histidine kinase
MIEPLALSAEPAREDEVALPNRQPPRYFLPLRHFILVQCAVVIPTYVYTLLGPGGLVAHEKGWGAVILWTAVIGTFLIFPHLFLHRAVGRAAQIGYLAAYLVLAAWALWLADFAATSLFLFYLVLGNAVLFDRRLGRIIAVAGVLIVYGEAYLLIGRRDSSVYVTVLPWIAGEVFTVTTMVLVMREQEARRQSEQLLSDLQAAHEQLRVYAEQVDELATMRERARLAQELHDSVSQTLFSASLIADALPQLWARRPETALNRAEELRRLTRGALAEMRSLLLELRPAALTQMALGDLLAQLAKAAGGRTRVPITVAVEGACALAPDVQVALYRIAQEALNNSVKYAEAGHITVIGHLADRRVMVEVRDDGVGFDPSAVRAGHFGLGIMRERAAAIGAEVTVESGPGRGTTVSVLWRASSEDAS